MHSLVTSALPVHCSTNWAMKPHIGSEDNLLMRRSCRGHGFESRWSPDFFRLLLSNCLNWKIYCDDHSSLSSTTAVQNELFHVYFTSIWSNLQIHFFIKASWKIELITEIRPSREERITVSSNYTAECVSNTKKEVGPLLISFNPAGGARMARWWEHSIPTNVSWVRVLVLTPDVSWVCCWFSPLLREVFLWVLQFSPLLKNQHFQSPIWPEIK